MRFPTWALFGLCGILLASSEPARAQPQLSFEADPSAGPLFAPPAQPSPLFRGPLPTGLPPGAAPAVTPHGVKYWMVSTHPCRQHGVPGCCEHFLHKAPGCELRQVSRAELLGGLTPGVPICIFIHGSFIDWSTMLRESDATARWLCRADPACRVNFVFYTWPSAEQLTLLLPVDVNILGRRAAFNSHYLARFLEQLPPESPVTLIGHSHGARVAVSTLHLLGGGEIHGFVLPSHAPRPRRIRTVLAAAAIDHYWLNPGERYDRALWSSEGVLNLYNSRDAALQIYPLRKPFGAGALGQTGLQEEDRQLLGPAGDRLFDIDVAPLLAVRHVWSRYLEHPQIAEMMVPYAFYLDPLAQRKLFPLGSRPSQPRETAVAFDKPDEPTVTLPTIPVRFTQETLETLRGLNLRDDRRPRR